MELEWVFLNLSCNDIHKANSVDNPTQLGSLNPFHVHTQVWVSVLLESHNKSDILVNHPWLTSLLLSNNFKFFDINNSEASKRKFSKWSSGRFYDFYRDFYRLRLDDNRFTVIYGKQADNSLLKVIGYSPFYEIYGRNTLRFAWKTLTNLPQSLTHSSFIDLSLKSSLWHLLRYSVLGTISEVRVQKN